MSPRPELVRALGDLATWRFAVTATVLPRRGHASWMTARASAYAEIHARFHRTMCKTNGILMRSWSGRADKIRAAGFIEKPLAFPHVHVAVAGPATVDLAQFTDAFEHSWRRFSAGGSVLVKPYMDSGWLRYAAKHSSWGWGGADEDALVLFL